MRRYWALLPFVLGACTGTLPGIGSVGPVPGRFNAGISPQQTPPSALPSAQAKIQAPVVSPLPTASPSATPSPFASAFSVPPTPSPSPDGAFVTTIVDSATLQVTYYQAPGGVAFDPTGNLYVTQQRSVISVLMRQGGGYFLAGTEIGAGVGNLNGPGSVARFRAPKGLACDASGNLYVADSGNHSIRMVSPSGVVSTIAGNGTGGWSDGASSSAQFNLPGAVAVDSLGNVLVADTNNHCIRRITPAGTVTTIAGQPGIAGFTDGPAASARFNFPSGIAVDPAGTVYVSDTDNHRIRAISGGVVRTLAGNGVPGWADGAPETARFNNPGGLALDATGDLVVADTFNHRIRMVLPSGPVVTAAGNGLAGQTNGVNNATSSAEFDYPSAVAVDASGLIGIADTDNDRLRVIVPHH